MTASTGRPAGIALGAASVAAVFFMAFHPTVASGDIAGFVAEVAREQAVNGTVHGALIAVIGVLLLGLLGLSERIGLHRGLVRAALVAYAIGSVAMILAATNSGFIVPGLAMRYHDADAAQLETLRPVLTLCRAALHALDGIGVVGWSLAVVLWSLELVRRPGAARAIGVLGLVCGAGPLLATAVGHLPVTVHGVLAFVVAQVLWYVAIAVQLARGAIWT